MVICNTPKTVTGTVTSVRRDGHVMIVSVAGKPVPSRYTDLGQPRPVPGQQVEITGFPVVGGHVNLCDTRVKAGGVDA